MRKRFWLSLCSLPWQEATEEQYMQAERAAGFFSRSVSGPATSGFSSLAIRGTTTNGEVPHFASISHIVKNSIETNESQEC